MKFNLFKTKIYLSFWFMCILCLMLIFDNTGNALMSLTVIALHEICHIVFIVLFGGKVSEFKLSLCEMNIRTEKEFLTNFQNLIVSISAPLFNFFLAFIFWEKYNSFAQINAVVASLQILPIISLDGDSALKAICCKKKIRKIISFTFCLCFAVLGMYILIRSKYNFSLLIMSLYLIFITCKY